MLVHQGGVVLLANPACMRLLGASLEEQLLTRSVDELVRADHLAAFRAIADIGERVASRAGEFSEQVWIALDGTERTVEVAGGVVEYAGSPAIQVVLLRDVTERKRAEVLQQAQNHVLNQIAQNGEVASIMQTLVHYIELHAPALSMCSDVAR